MKKFIQKSLITIRITLSFVLLISCDNTNEKSSKRLNISDEKIIDLVSFENGNTRMSASFDGKSTLNKLKYIKQYTVDRKLFSETEFNLDEEKYLTTVYDLNGDILYKINNLGITFINELILDELNRFWNSDINEYYSKFEVKEKIKSRFESGEKKEIVRFISNGSVNVPIERLIYRRQDDTDEVLITEHHRLLGDKRRLRVYDDIYTDNGDVNGLVSDTGIYSDDLINFGYDVNGNDFLVENITYKFDKRIDNHNIQNNTHWSEIKVVNFDKTLSFTSGTNSKYIVYKGDNYYDEYYSSESDLEFFNYETFVAKKGILSNIYSYDYPDEFLDNSTYDGYSSSNYKENNWRVYNETNSLSFYGSQGYHEKKVTNIDSLGVCNLGIDKRYVYHNLNENKDEIVGMKNDNLIFKYFDLTNLEPNKPIAEIYHPNGSLLANVSYEFVDDEGEIGSYTNDVRERNLCGVLYNHPTTIKIVNYYDEDGNHLGEGRFKPGFNLQNFHDNNINDLIGDKYSEINEYGGISVGYGGTLISGVSYTFFHTTEDYSINDGPINNNKNPIIKEIMMNEDGGFKITEFNFDFNIPNYSYSLIGNEELITDSFFQFREGSIRKKRESTFNKNYKKDGKEIIFGDKEVIVEEINWGNGEKISDF